MARKLLHSESQTPDLSTQGKGLLQLEVWLRAIVRYGVKDRSSLTVRGLGFKGPETEVLNTYKSDWLSNLCRPKQQHRVAVWKGGPHPLHCPGGEGMDIGLSRPNE